MNTPTVSIIIPTYNHGQWICDAVRSAVSQTHQAIDVIVVDDGSTDDTQERLERLSPTLQLAHGSSLVVTGTHHDGPSRARNMGLDMARGEFVMFLDADDVLAPTKVARQLAAFTDDVGWVICDVRIEDESKGKVSTASQEYREYQDLGGWIGKLLERRNFIPIMSPLVRRSVLGGERERSIRFSDLHAPDPEDWHFWKAVARNARARYVPEVLATYRHRRTGRSRMPKTARAVQPTVTEPLRLNLGCGTPGTRSWHPIDGLVNMDKSLGWRFEDGLGEFLDASVAGITVSHALMYVREEAWPPVFAEFARVLRPGGVIRITEDDTDNPASSRYGGWKGSEPAVARTSALRVLAALTRAGLTAYEVQQTETRYADTSLVQAQHGTPPDVFFVEGVRDKTLLLSPHADDEALFAAFSILRWRPHVVICHPSSGDYGPTDVRLGEVHDAMSVLGGTGVEQWDGIELETKMRALDARLRPARVLAPHWQTSHPDHVLVSELARRVFAGRLVYFHTYDQAGKVRRGRRVDVEPAWVGAKLRALARYESQHRHPRAHRFFLDDLVEYLEEEHP